MNILTFAMNPAKRHTKVPKSRLLVRKLRGPRVAIHPHSSACSDTNKQKKQQQQDNGSSNSPTAFWDQTADTSDVRRPTSPQHLSSLTEDTFVPARVIDISELEEVTSCPIAVATTVDTLDTHEEENDEENGGDRDSGTVNSHSSSKSSFQIMVYKSYAIVALAFIW